MKDKVIWMAAGLLAAAVGIVSVPEAVAQSPQVTTGLAPPVQLTSEQDHQRLMDLLHISELRRGPDGDPTSPNAANFDESKVAPYTLPNPLLLRNGQRVTSTELWWKARRPQIVADFDNELYGHVPANVPKVTWEVVRTRHETVDKVPVVTKDLVGHVDNSAYPLISVDIQLTVTTPEHAAGPVPVMLEFGLTPEVQGTLRKRFTNAQWAAYMGPGPSWQSLVLAQGWGYAVLIPTSVQADNGEGLTQGIIGLTNKGQPRQPGDWGALRAWAWGASRALDYLQSDSAVNGRQVGIEGLSRYGKATLVTMAYEPRFAIAFVGSSGEAGAKLSRRTFGEQVENIASSSEYHWMAGNFLKYAGPLTRNDLPVDAHELIALCAPRPVFISSGAQAVEGGWVDAKGMFLGAVGAGPVYKLLHKNDLGTTEFPPMETALIDGDIAFRQHRYGHTTGPNWPTFLTFASRYIKGPALQGNAQNNTSIGVFEGQADIGAVVPPGTGIYDAAAATYTLTSAGALFLSMKGEPLHQVGASVNLHLEEPFYVGLGAVSHDVSTTDKVVFSKVTAEPVSTAADDTRMAFYSTLRTIQIEDQFRRAMVIRTSPTYMHSANWTTADGSAAEQVTDDSNINSSPHVSPDGRTVAFLSQPANEGSLGIGDAALKVFAVSDGLVRTVATFQGDRGSFAMYGWGDADHVAFVSYQAVPEVPL